MALKMQVPLDVEEGKHDLLCHLIILDVNHIRDDIERALKEEMQQKIQKQITELHASLKMELLEAIQKDITSLIKKSNLELKDDMTQYIRNEISLNMVELVAIKVYLEKGLDAMEKYISIVKANVNKEMQTWAEMAKDAKAQVEHADKDIKANTP